MHLVIQLDSLCLRPVIEPELDPGQWYTPAPVLAVSYHCDLNTSAALTVVGQGCRLGCPKNVYFLLLLLVLQGKIVCIIDCMTDCMHMIFVEKKMHAYAILVIMEYFPETSGFHEICAGRIGLISNYFLINLLNIISDNIALFEDSFLFAKYCNNWPTFLTLFILLHFNMLHDYLHNEHQNKKIYISETP